MKTLITALLGCFCFAQVATADVPFKFSLRSRALLDASLSKYNKEDLQGFYRLEDFRIGFKAKYQQYELKADIGLTNKKVAIKDFLFNYHFKHSFLSLGNAYEPFGMDMLISTVDLRFHQSAVASQAFCEGRKLGLTYNVNLPKLYAATGLYADRDVNDLGKEGGRNNLTSTSRLVLRDQHEDRLLHVGTAFSYRSRPVNTTDPYLETREGEGVTSLFGPSLLHAEIPGLQQEMKGVVELLFTGKRWLFQTEYFYNRIHFENEKTHGVYNPLGVYAQASFLAIGQGFAYDAANALAGRPASDRALELTARFDYNQMNRKGIMGGEEKDFSIGANFYFNKYLSIKLNGSYVWTDSHCHPYFNKDMFLVQTRLQYAF